MSFWQLDTWKKLFGGTPTGAAPNATGDLSQQVRYLTANYPPTLGIIDVQVFTVSGTWYKPAGAKWLEVIIVAAGGGGGGYNTTYTTCGGGGGGGARYFWSFPASAVGSSVVVTIGAGGSGGGVNSAGGGGGQTKFGDLGIYGAFGGSNPTTANWPGMGGPSATFASNAGGWQIPTGTAASSIYDYRQASVSSNATPPAATGMAGGTAGSGFGTNLATPSSPSYFGGGAGGTANNPGAITSVTLAQGPDSPVPGYGGAGGHGGSSGANPSPPNGRPGGYPGGGGGSASHNASSSGGAGGNGQVVVIAYG